MANDSVAQPLNGWEKRDIVESTLKSGDATAANNVLNTVQDQKLFMNLLASKAEGDSIPGLVITNDKQGNTHEVKSDKITISDAGGHLSAHSNSRSFSEYVSDKWHAVTSFGNGVGEAVKDAAKQTELGDALSKAGTSQSLTNQRIDAHVERAEKGTN